VTLCEGPWQHSQLSNVTVLVCMLLQLESIDGEIWANIWQTECIARICPDSGKVKGWVLMHGLRANLESRGLSNNPMDVLNGKHGHNAGQAWGHRGPKSRTWLQSAQHQAARATLLCNMLTPVDRKDVLESFRAMSTKLQ